MTKKQTGKLGSSPVDIKETDVPMGSIHTDNKLDKEEGKLRWFEHVAEEHRVYYSPRGKDKNKGLGVIPRRATSSSAGYDLHTPVSFVIGPGEKVLIWTNIKVAMQPSEVLLVNVRSSVGTKKNIVLTNTQGVIDADYYSNPQNDGNIGMSLKNVGNKAVEFKAGEAICQGIFFNYLLVDNDIPLSETREGGFGSTDKK